MLLVPVICGLLFNTGIAFITIPVLLLLLLGINLLSLPLKFLFSPKQVLDSRGALSVCFALLFGLLALLPVGLFIFNLPPLTQLPAGYLGALLVAILLCVTFTRMVPRYTQRGLNHLAIARGLKLYLGTAERHRYQALYPPDKLVAHLKVCCLWLWLSAWVKRGRIVLHNIWSAQAPCRWSLPMPTGAA